MNKDLSKYNYTTSLEEHLRLFAEDALLHANAKKEYKARRLQLVKHFLKLHYDCNLSYKQISDHYKRYTGHDMSLHTPQKAIKKFFTEGGVKNVK